MTHPDFRVKQIQAIFPSSGESGALENAIKKMCDDADRAIIDNMSNIILISDRHASRDYAAIPSLLAVGALHNHLIQNGMRVRVGIIVEAGDVVETHHFATLIGYGANAVNPYLSLETIASLQQTKYLSKDITDQTALANYI